jgi:hypothetical protein
VEKTDEENFKNVDRKNRFQIGFQIKEKAPLWAGPFL